MTDQQKEIELLDKVLMKFAMSEDNQLEQCMTIFLVPSLAKMGSPFEPSRKKVPAHLTHPPFLFPF